MEVKKARKVMTSYDFTKDGFLKKIFFIDLPFL